jgi:hypothetical protein
LRDANTTTMYARRWYTYVATRHTNTNTLLVAYLMLTSMHNHTSLLNIFDKQQHRIHSISHSIISPTLERERERRSSMEPRRTPQGQTRQLVSDDSILHISCIQFAHFYHSYSHLNKNTRSPQPLDSTAMQYNTIHHQSHIRVETRHSSLDD